jgi:hypothetical protein
MSEKVKNKSALGGARPGAGRKKGGMNQATLERLQVEKELKQRVLKNANRLYDAQFSLAQGLSYLFVIKTETDKKGNKRKLRPELITSPIIIESYLNGDYEEDTEDEYFFITTKAPDNKAIDSLLDRTFGKAQQSLDVTSQGDKLGVIVLPQKNVNTLEADNQTGRSSS